MLLSLHDIVGTFRGAIRYHFYLVWAVSLVFVPTAVWWSGRRDATRPLFPGGETTEKVRSKWQIGSADGLAAIVFLLFASAYAAMLLYKVDFNTFDSDELTEYSVRGIAFGPPIWPHMGRFFPLMFCEFDVLRFITRSAAGYHSFVVAQLLVLLLVVFLTFDDFQIRFRVPVLIAIMMVPGVAIIFTGLVFPERNILFWFAILALCLHRYSRTQAPAYFIGSLVATQFALYYKEPIVVFVVVFVLFRLLLELYLSRSAGLHLWSEFVKNNLLSFGMLVLAAIYVVVFLTCLGWSFLHAEAHTPLSFVLWRQLKIDWLPIVLLTVFIVRLWLFKSSVIRFDAVWDALAAGALSYYLCIDALGLSKGYYTAPADFISILYCARMALLWMNRSAGKSRVRAVLVTATVFMCVVIHDAAFASFRIVEHKSISSSKTEFATFLKDYTPTVRSGTLELFFPYSDGYNLMLISSYLRYKGFALEGWPSAQGEERLHLVIKSPRWFASGRGVWGTSGNRCIVYREYACFHADKPSPDALIVVLPNDEASNADIEKISKSATPLLEWKLPNFFASYNPWFRLLSVDSDALHPDASPEHWLRLHVFRANRPQTCNDIPAASC